MSRIRDLSAYWKEAGGEWRRATMSLEQTKDSNSETVGLTNCKSQADSDCFVIGSNSSSESNNNTKTAD